MGRWLLAGVACLALGMSGCRSLIALCPICYQHCEPCDSCDSCCSSCPDGQTCRPHCRPTAFGRYWPWCDEVRTVRSGKRCGWRALQQWERMNGFEASEDFEEGFIQAFADINNGYSGVTPAVPPERYWQACYRSGAGHNCVREWFNGYEAGANAARSWGVDQFNWVATSVIPESPPQMMSTP